jgi:hypothetical protein
VVTRDGQSWIAVVRPSRTAHAIPPAVVAELERRGRPARLFVEGDAAFIDAEAVVLMGSLGSMRRTSRWLRRCRDKRPFVVAWASEPLPPSGIPSWALDLAQALSPVHVGTRWARPLMHFFTYPVHLVIHRFGLPADLRREIGPSTSRFLLENLAFLRLGLRDGWIDAVAVSTEQKRLYLAELGIESTFMPVGQQPGFGRMLDLQRDIDVLFIGNIKTRRRRRRLDHVFAELRKRGLTTYVPRDPIFGEARTRLVNRARIMLNLQNYPWDTPWMRWNLAIANGAVVASEPLSVPWPLRPGADFLSAPIQDLPGAIAALAGNEEGRKTMLENCCATMAREMSLEGSIDRLCDILDTRHPVETDR